MIDRETLKRLGWSDELISAAVQVAEGLPASVPDAVSDRVGTGRRTTSQEIHANVAQVVSTQTRIRVAR